MAKDHAALGVVTRLLILQFRVLAQVQMNGFVEGALIGQVDRKPSSLDCANSSHVDLGCFAELGVADKLGQIFEEDA